MSDENTTTDAQQSQDSGTNNQNDAPEWARRAITEANNEAAKYRNKAKTVADETRAEVAASFNEQIKSLSDEKTSIAEERDTVASDYNKLVAALHAGVPGDTAVEFAAVLQGNNLDEYKAHAEKLKGMFGNPKQKAVDHTAGFSGNTETSPEAAFAAIFKSNLTR